MFTGIVQAKGVVSEIKSFEQGQRLSVEVDKDFLKRLKRGASIAVNGVCLTVTDFSEGSVNFDVIEETLKVTNISYFKEGDLVNMERSLKFGDEVGGHILSGHVSCTCEATKYEGDKETEIRVNAPKEWTKFIFKKGYVALNGVSLTVGKVESNYFSVYLIPETLEVTNLGIDSKKLILNLEVDQNTVAIVNAHN
ncbi:MAG: riboflavin synthase subunit alpha [Pseudomonadota bacterium]|nr:riboflavin synthase subunit alpha [Pseudomonadota bacterium]